ncbi:hypothetical protein ACLOJK_005454 [Asimina triloba]
MAEEEQHSPAATEEDDEHGSKERVVLKYFLLEWETVKSLLDAIVSNGRVTDPSAVGKIRSIVDKYQEQGQLLEPYLESIVCPLMHIVQSKTIELGVDSEEILEIIKPICIIIYSLVTACGYKMVIKFFPHQVSDLELAVSLLEKSHRETVMMSLRQESTGEMETKCILLLWLCILVLIPFDISSVDTSIANCDYNGELEPSPLVLRILGFSKDYLSNAGPMRRIAGLLLSRLLTRPDMLKAFSSTDNLVDHFRLLGTVEALAAIFKVGSRKFLLGMIPVVWNDASSLIKSTAAARSSLLRKFLLKLSQRMGLACLPHRSSSWHYVHVAVMSNLKLMSVMGFHRQQEVACRLQKREEVRFVGSKEEEQHLWHLGSKDVIASSKEVMGFIARFPALAMAGR